MSSFKNLVILRKNYSRQNFLNKFELRIAIFIRMVEKKSDKKFNLLKRHKNNKNDKFCS